MDLIALHKLMHHDIYIVHASYSFRSIYFYANLQSALGFVFFDFFFSICYVFLVLILAPCLGKLELVGFPLVLLCFPLGVNFLRTIVVVKLLRN